MSTDDPVPPEPPSDPAQSPTFPNAEQTSPEMAAASRQPLPPLEDVDDVEPTIGPAETRENRQRKRLDHVLELLKTLVTPGRRRGSLGRLDNYEVLDVVGQGAMGVVVKAWDESLQRTVAIKLMAPHLLASENAKERFFREARAAAGISHPNVVTIHAVAETKGVPFLVMEYIEGQSLDDRIHSRPLDTQDVLRISQQMAAGLAAAHRHGLVHRDVKPSNVLLEDSVERVRIADFGLARVAMETSELTSAGQIVGTPAYMSPEQVNGERLDPRSDLFSMGCVMYAMYAGHSPFQAPNGLVASRLVLSKEPDPLGSISDRAPPYLCEIIHRLLNKNPQERFQTAEDLEKVLTRHLRTWDSFTNTPTIVAAKPPRSSAFSPWTLVLAMLLLLAAGFFAYPYLPQGAIGQPLAPAGPSPSGVSRENPPIVGPPPVLAVQAGALTVARNGTARFLNLADAISAASPGNIIQILDAGPYEGSISFNDPERLAGVKVLGNQSVLTASQGPVLRVAGVSDLTLEGLVVNVSGHRFGLEVVGDCPGLTIQKCAFQSVDRGDDFPSLVYFHDGAAGTDEHPIVLRDSEIRCATVGIVLGDESASDTSKVVHDIQITGCRIGGLMSGHGTTMIAFDGLENIEISRNLLEVGGAAVTFNLARPDSARRFHLAWNTLRGYEYAMHLNASELVQNIRISNNLFLDVVNFPLIEPARFDQVTSWFSGNVWAHPVEDLPLIERLAERRDQILVKSESAGNPDYLVPVDESIQAGRSRGLP
ncbi:MAG: serine/threonine-protein kinase [Planctomycetaceae bacterium]|nr:serine/threonine-protein kinase [Planctomycetaceae bacterium]